MGEAFLKPTASVQGVGLLLWVGWRQSLGMCMYAVRWLCKGRLLVRLAAQDGAKCSVAYMAEPGFLVWAHALER